ncbi:MAG: HD domain-containing protein [Verrucomicrobia bacterium]|nr:HD domain-containing protein [Verrucomicrobiota bacterium]
MQLSPQFEKALTYATRIHGGQPRKKTGIPYIAHILGVAAIAMEYGANETEAIAALLHDAVEDCGGAKRLRDIERKFGKEVARIVEGCTDTDQSPKPPWLERKKAYLAHVGHAPMPTKLVSASDKLHNVRAILMDYREEGERLWSRFNAGKQGALWYYRALVNAFSGKRIQHLVQELDRALTELELLSNKGAQVKQPPGPR